MFSKMLYVNAVQNKPFRFIFQKKELCSVVELHDMCEIFRLIERHLMKDIFIKTLFNPMQVLGWKTGLKTRVLNISLSSYFSSYRNTSLNFQGSRLFFLLEFLVIVTVRTKINVYL